MIIDIDNDRMDTLNLKCIAALLCVTRQQVYNNLEQGMPRNSDGTFDWPACMEWDIERKILAKHGKSGLHSYREGRLRDLLEAAFDRGRPAKTGTEKAWAKQIERLRASLSS